MANGYGVTSLVERVVPGECLPFRHRADTQDAERQARDNRWTGGQERYSPVENGRLTTLTVEFGVPAELEAYFADHYPKALERVKALAERC